jgi:hypothetical protein
MKPSQQDEARGRTLEFWQPHYPDDEISSVEADSMVSAISEFITVLAEWELAEKSEVERSRRVRKRLGALRNKVRNSSRIMPLEVGR